MVQVTFKRKLYNVRKKNLIVILSMLGYDEEKIKSEIDELEKEQKNNEECSIDFLKKYGLYNEVFLKRINRLIKNKKPN